MRIIIQSMGNLELRSKLTLRPATAVLNGSRVECHAVRTDGCIHYDVSPVLFDVLERLISAGEVMRTGEAVVVE